MVNTTSQDEPVLLKPCPFCGGSANIIYASGHLWPNKVQCTKCGAMSGGSAYKNDIWNAKMWNERVSNDG